MEIGSDSPVYGISVAAELTGVDAQMLRAYEARGLIDPYRTQGGTRRYSNDDLAKVNHISDLLGGGLNLAGIVVVFVLEAENLRLRTELDALRAASGPAQGRGAVPRRKSVRAGRS